MARSVMFALVAALCLLVGACTPAATPVTPGGTTGPTPVSSDPQQAAEEFDNLPDNEDHADAAPVAPDTPEVTRIGSSVDGRDIHVYRFGAGSRSVLILGGVHGNEYGAEVAEAFMATLETSAAEIPEGVAVHVIPCLNPDGRAADSRGNSNGVDLNLNLPTDNWRRDLHPATSAARAGLDGGPHPGSEPENQALLGYLEAIEFDLIVSLHSSGGVIDWDGEAAEPIAREMARICGLSARQLAVQQYATGTLGQYATHELGVPVITIELESRELGEPLRQALLLASRGL